MDGQELQRMRNYLENTQVTLQTAYYSKVGANWKENNLLPDVNRFYYIREGAGWIKLRNRLYRPRPGQLLLLPAGMRLSYGIDGDDGFGKYWCHFTATVGDVGLFHMLEVPHCLDVRDEAWLEGRFLELIRHYRSPSLTAPLRIKTILLEMVSAYIEQAVESGERVRMTPSAETGKINAVLTHIERHLREPMTVEELAGLAHFHPNYFMQYFKSILGVSPIAYINRKRMEKARELLSGTSLSVTDIAEEIGLELYYFSRLFKKWTGFSPSEYRKNAAEAGAAAYRKT